MKLNTAKLKQKLKCVAINRAGAVIVVGDPSAIEIKDSGLFQRWTDDGIDMMVRFAEEMLEAELASARSQLKNITDNAYILENTIRLLRTENADREKDSYAKDRVKTLEGLHAEIAELEKKYFDVALLNTELREQLAAARELGPCKLHPKQFFESEDPHDPGHCTICYELDKAYVEINCLRNREKASIAAALEPFSKLLRGLEPFQGGRDGDMCLWCQRDRSLKIDSWEQSQDPEYHDTDCEFIAAIRAITPDQSDARGVLQDEGQSPNGNPPAPEMGARTEG